MRYDKKATTAREIEENGEITRIIHQNESEKNVYVIVKNEMVKDFLGKYGKNVFITERLIKFKMLQRTMTDTELKDLLI